MAGEATVYVQWGSFHRPVKDYVMHMLYEVNLIFGESFMRRVYLHVALRQRLHYDLKGHMTVNSRALPRVQPSVEKGKFDSVSSALLLKRLARKGACTFWQ